ncbi:hypothetical protein F4782DRAFT_217437 [Xylaria castorea]|nr:hypothetical protein F4782DRAFT_217437 [Xylaria castorea]
MASAGINADVRDDSCEKALQEHKRNTNENRIICLGFAAEDGHGDKELLLREQNLLSVTPDSPRTSKACDLLRSISLIPSRPGTTSEQDDIVYFDHDTLEELELHQTGPLQRAADVKTVALDWSSLLTQEKLRETLMTVYSRLRNIERIIIVVDHSSQCTTIGREVQGVIRNQTFWQECNGRYALEQILPMKIRPLDGPRICLMQIARGCEHEGGPRLLPQLTPLAPHDLALDSADIDGLQNPAQQEEPVIADYSLQDLLD